MAECLEDFDFDFYNMNRTYTNTDINRPNNTSALQLIDLAEKEGFDNIELSDINFPDGIIFNRIQRLDKINKLKICNTNIATLANMPSDIKEIIIKKGDIHIANFRLISTEVTNISIINNKVKTILYLNLLINLVYIDLSQNNLEEIPPLPDNVITFIATHNKIKKIRNLNAKLCELNLSNNLISEMTNIPIGIESINISRNQIMIVDLSLFEKLKVFKAYNNQINLIIGPIASNIEVFDVFNNFLQQIPDIGLKIKELDLSNNDLKVLPKFGTTILERIDITKNPLLKLCDDEIVMLMDINRLNNSLIVMCDQFDMPNNEKVFNMTSSSSSSEFDLSDIYANTDDDATNIKQNQQNQQHQQNQQNHTNPYPYPYETNMKHFDILELLNRNRRMQQINQKPIINQPIIIRGKQIYKRRTYEM